MVRAVVFCGAVEEFHDAVEESGDVGDDLGSDYDGGVVFHVASDYRIEVLEGFGTFQSFAIEKYV